MSVVEGYSEHVMDAIAAEVIPDHEQLREAMDRRRRSRSAPQRIIERLLGFDVKLRQYELGKKFADAVVELGGIEALNRVWSSPEALPVNGRTAAPKELARTHRACRQRRLARRRRPGVWAVSMLACGSQDGPPRGARLRCCRSALVPSATCNGCALEVYVHVFVGILLWKLNLIRS